MDPQISARLRCPLCAGGLAPAGGALRCPAGHSFDVARQGYVNLSTGRARHPGDSADMVAARARVLDAGHFAVLTRALAAAARDTATGGPAPLVVDVGAGTGHHLAGVLDALPGALGLALDVSKAAARRAARAHPRAGAALADAWGPLPLPDGAAALLLNVFAPRNGAEFRRVLAPGGRLLVATPEPDHLAGLVDALGLLRVAPDKPERVAAALPGFAPAGSATHTARLVLDRAAAAALVAMGPSAWHTDPAAVRRRLAESPTPIPAEVSVRLTLYRAAAAG